jgi:hypothetical protein
MSVKIVVVSGPNRGATYFLQEGENSLGRSPDNPIVLASTQVSKKHCALICKGAKVEMQDLGSSNGTFVNGVLTKKKLLQNRDRVSLGPFVLEVLIPQVVARPAAIGATDGTSQGFQGAAGAALDLNTVSFKDEEPKSIFGKYKKKFDDVFLPVVYDFYEKTDYPTLFGMIFAIYMFLNLGFTVYPVLQRSREEVLRQAESQAVYISKQVALLNRQAILEGKEGALITDFADAEPNVKEVVVATVEGRILAPGSRLNESYNNPLFLKYRTVLQKNQNLWTKPFQRRMVEEEEVIAMTPIMVMSKAKGYNVPGAVAVVIYSTAAIALDPGTVGTIYFEALAWSAILGVVFLYIVFMMTHKPLHKLNDDMDKVLKGEMESVEKKYKNDVLDQLIDTLNSALSRIPKSGAAGGDVNANAGGDEQAIVENCMRAVEYIAGLTKQPVLVLDLEMRVRAGNNGFEELTGIRGAVGEVIDSVSRDESFPSLLKEMAEKAAAAAGEETLEDYDFPSGTHKIHAQAVFSAPGKTEAYLFFFEKQGE